MSLQGNTVLITGATGFLGGKLARRLIRDGAHVRVITRKPERAAALAELGAEVFTADLTDAESLKHAAEGCTVVFHAAVDYTSYANQVRVNVDGTRALAEASKRANVKQIVHVSSIAAYGYGVRGDVYEDRALVPTAHPYTITKADGEAVIRASNLEYAIIRPGMIYGADADIWTNGVFRLATLRPTVWLDDGGGCAPFIHADDVIDLMIVAADHPNAANQIFHCTPDPSPSWRDVLTLYARLNGHEWQGIPVKPLAQVVGGLMTLFAPRVSFARDLPEMIGLMTEPVTYHMDKARDLLGWTPQTALVDGIASCAASLRKNGLLV